MRTKKIAVAASSVVLLISGWLPVATVGTVLTIGGAAMTSGCHSNDRQEARTEARTGARADERVENRHD